MKSVSLLVLIILFICAALAPYLYNQLKPYYSLEGFDNHKSLENISVENIGVNNSYPLTENNPLLAAVPITVSIYVNPVNALTDVVRLVDAFATAISNIF